ncbi:MAG: inhA [Firmicutes bacterium]|nr:inhA [Bacillota bacterium]
MKKVLLLLANGFEMLEASVFTDVLGWNQSDGDGTTQVVTCGLHKEILSTWGVTVIPEVLVGDVEIADFEALAIPGGFEEAGFYEDAYHSKVLSLIRQFHDAGKMIATICVGALPVGKSGILKGRRGTTYHLNQGIRREQLAEYGVEVINQPIVVDGKVITSSCPATAIDVAFILLERLTSTENCCRIRHLMGFE